MRTEISVGHTTQKNLLRSPLKRDPTAEGKKSVFLALFALLRTIKPALLAAMAVDTLCLPPRKNTKRGGRQKMSLVIVIPCGGTTNAAIEVCC